MNLSPQYPWGRSIERELPPPNFNNLPNRVVRIDAFAKNRKFFFGSTSIYFFERTITHKNKSQGTMILSYVSQNFSSQLLGSPKVSWTSFFSLFFRFGTFSGRFGTTKMKSCTSCAFFRSVSSPM